MARKKQKLRWLNKLWMRYEYKHTTLALLCIWLFILLLDSALMAAIFGFIENTGYIGGIIAGVLSVSFFTAAPAAVLLIDLATKVDPHILALSWAIGSTLGDWFVLRFYQEKVFHELRPLFIKLGFGRQMRSMRRRYTSWLMFIFGLLIIATPLPDEAGLGMMGLSHLKRPIIVTVCFLVNLVGALILVLAVRAIGG